MLSLLMVGLNAPAEDYPGLEGGPPPLLLSILDSAGVDGDEVSLIAAARSHTDPTVRLVAIEVLGHRKEKESIEVLRFILRNDEDALLRESAAFALAKMGEEEGLAALQKALEDASDAKEQILTASRLAEVGDSRGYSYVARVLVVRGSDGLRTLAVNSLSNFINIRAQAEEFPGPEEILLRLLDDESKEVRSAALTQASIVAGRQLEVDRVMPYVQRLISQDPAPELREQAKLLVDAWRAVGRGPEDHREQQR